MWRAALVLLFAISAPALGQSRSVIRSSADLPSRRFPLNQPASQAFLSDDFLRRTVPAVREEVERILANSTIEDPSIRTQLLAGLAAIAVLEQRSAEAERRIGEARQSETKAQLRAIGWLLYDAASAGNAATGARRCAAVAARITQRLAGTDPNVVRDEVLIRYGQVQTASPGYVGGGIVGEVDPIVSQRGSVDLMDALFLIRSRLTGLVLPPCRAEMVAAYRTWLDDPANRPQDIWPSRQPDAATFADARPVTVAIWDTGIDPEIFAGRMAIDRAEPLDGRDNDRNGIIDDVHGPTFDIHIMPTRFAVEPPSAVLAPQFGFANAISSGQSDLNFGIDTVVAQMTAARGRDAPIAEQGVDADLQNEVFSRSHGTFVASQVAEGLDWLRLYNVRLIPWGFTPRRVPVAEPEVERLVAALPNVIRRMRGAGVRIANLSWINDIDGIVSHLMSTGQESDAARARQRAERMHGQYRAALTSAFAAAPDILFVVAAGNENTTEVSQGGIPQSIRAPNIIVVGATGQTGRPTSFTTYGPGVHLYARGEALRGRYAGGSVAYGSGTSYAAPQVSRAAAQMLAVNPRLTPADLIQGLIQSATTTEGAQPVRLLHPAQAVAWAQQRRR